MPASKRARSKRQSELKAGLAQAMSRPAPVTVPHWNAEPITLNLPITLYPHQWAQIPGMVEGLIAQAGLTRHSPS